MIYIMFLHFFWRTKDYFILQANIKPLIALAAKANRNTSA